LLVQYTALGVEITEDRTRTWIALAGAEDRRIVVDLLPPIDGTDAVPTISDLWGKHPVDAVALAPRGPAATLLDGLRNDGMPIVEADAVALEVALGRFLDWTKAGKLKHRGDHALTDAVRLAASKRSSSGAQAVDRAVNADMAPLVAAELAVWALGDPDSDNQPGVYVL
jgi:hypothetical protein